MDGLMEDDLPPLLSDTEGSDGSDLMPDLEGTGSSSDEEEPTAAAVGAHHGTHTAHHQQQQHARHPHQRPMSEQQRRMEAGINRSSRLWQVPDGADSLAHSLGASPFDEEHSGGSGMPGVSGMPVLQILPTISPDGSMMLTASLSVSPAGMASTRAATAAAAPNPLRNTTRLGATSAAAGGASSSSSAAGGQRTGPLFVDGQQRSGRNGPASAFQGLAMPFLMGGSPGMSTRHVNFLGPAAAGAAAGAAGATFNSGSSLRFVPLSNPHLPTTSSAARSVPGFPPGRSSNANGAAAVAAAGSRRSVIAGSMPQGSASGDNMSFFEAMGMAYGVGSSSQASSDSGSLFPGSGSSGPFRSGPHLRARRTRQLGLQQQSAASATAARAGRAASSAPGATGGYTFSSTPPQAGPPAPPAPAAAAAGAAGPAGEEAAAVALAQAGRSSSSSSSSPGAQRGQGSAEGEAAAAEQQVSRQQGRRWWHPWRILASGWGLISSLILGARPRSSSSSSGGETGGGSTPGAAAATTAAAPPSSFDILCAAGSAGGTGGAAFSLGLASPGPSSRPGASRDRSLRVRGAHHLAARTDCDYIPGNGGPYYREAEGQQQPARTWAFADVSPTAAAATTPAAPGTGGLSEAFGAARQQQQEVGQARGGQQQLQPAQASSAAAAVSPASRPRSSRPQGKRQRYEGDASDSSRPASTGEASPQAVAASAAAAAAAAEAGAAGSSCMPAVPAAGQASSSAASPGVADTAASTQQLVEAAPQAAAAAAAAAPARAGQQHETGDSTRGSQQAEESLSLVAAGLPAIATTAAAAAEEHDDSSDLPELLDTCPFADETPTSTVTLPALMAGNRGSDDGLAHSSGNINGDGSSSGPPSLDPTSDSASDVDGLSLFSRDRQQAAGSEGPPTLVVGPAAGPVAAATAAAAEEEDGPPDLVSGSEQEDSDDDDIDAWFRYNAAHLQQWQAWEPAGLQAGQHSSGLRPGFLQGQALHEAGSSSSTGQQQPQAAPAPPPAAAPPSNFYSMFGSYYNRTSSAAAAAVATRPPAQPAAAASRSAAAPAVAASADKADDSGSEGSWETASDQDVEHAAAAGAAAPGVGAATSSAGRLQPSDAYDGEDDESECGYSDDSCEDEDDFDDSDYDDDDEDVEEEEEEECDCPLCSSMRLINNEAAMQRFAASGVASRAMAAVAAAGTRAAGAPTFSRPRSNAFAVPGGRTTGAVDSLCGDTDGAAAPSSSSSGRHPAGIPLLPPRGGKKGRGAGAGARGPQLPQQLPEGVITVAASKARVDGLAVLLSDASFTQQLLAGLPVSVEAGHSSIQSALEMIRGKEYTPINTVSPQVLPGVVAVPPATIVDVQHTEAGRQAQRLLRQWSP